ncbi:sulfatase [Membranihabitans maritimus]|uniref:sulfatase n=1 Tax=Membranihabitans maritimus TaxID=2904244 RepID=UPI001F325FAC|nr:sulfatase [Membranihabitans maritimus]
MNLHKKNHSLLISFIIPLLVTACKIDKDKTIQDTEKPNVLFILVDDMGYMDLSCMGSEFYETPNIDRLAAKGVLFTRGYSSSRVCSPSRASIMTGMFTARHGITDWIGAASEEAWRSRGRHDKLLPSPYIHQLPKEKIVLPEAMKENGYLTFFAGKWHLGDKGSYPEDHGFDINIGGFERGSPPGGFFSPYKNPKMEDGPNGENLTKRLARETAKFITSAKDTSFFAYLAFYAVHAPVQSTKEGWAKYRAKLEDKDIPQQGFEMEEVLPIRKYQDQPVYAALVESVDQAVGIVINALTENNLENNTIVVFTSDNGGVASGDAYATSNTPLRGGKGYQWEGGTRVPYIIYAPGMKKNTSTINKPVFSTDFYPTLLDLTGSSPKADQHIDGISLKALLNGETYSERPFYTHYPHYGNQGGKPSSTITTGKWKLIHYYETNTTELYDLAEDLSETNDISGKKPDRVISMKKQLFDWLHTVNAKFPEPDPQFDPKAREKWENNIKTKRWQNLENQRQAMLKEDWKPNNDWWGSAVEN